MSVQTALHAHLIHQPTIAALVAERVMPVMEVPAKPTYPLITYQLISRTRPYHLRGSGGHVRAHFQLNAWAETSREVETLADAIRLAINNIDHATLGHGEETIFTLEAFIDDESDDSSEPADASLVGRHRRAIDLVIRYEESATPRR